MIKVLEEKKEERGNPFLCHQKMRRIKAVGHSVEINSKMIDQYSAVPATEYSVSFDGPPHLKGAIGDVCPSVRWLVGWSLMQTL